MAALSRPSLRSSARKDHVPELLATDSAALHERPTRHQGKRTRDSSLDNESNASSKRLKNSPQERTRIENQPLKPIPTNLPFRDKKPVQPSRKNAVQQVHKSRKAPTTEQHVLRTTSIENVHNRPFDGSSNGVDSAGTQTVATLNNKVDKRSLRSHDGGSRSKSELALYFPNYEELISIEPKAADALTSDSLLFIVDDAGPSTTASPSKNRSTLQPPASRGKASSVNRSAEVIEWSEATFTTLTDATRINLSISKPVGRTPKKDPLNDDLYIKIHRRLERQEKQLRNIEKERAMHEKVQLERLLDGLKGHDWLRVMGISGITDGEKKAYEPRRDHLIGEVRILLEKFRLWREEEKRRKVEKDEVAEEDEDDEEAENEEEDEEELEEDGTDAGMEEEQEEEEEEDADEKAEARGEEGEEEEEEEGGVSDGDPPDYSDIDASALQLRLEAARASQSYQYPYAPPPPSSLFSSFTTNPTTLPSSQQGLPVSSTTTRSQPASYTQQTITSFFSKPYHRQAALGNHRRGRSRYAFGHPLPEPDERSFELPREILTDDALAASERGRRAAKRRRESET